MGKARVATRADEYVDMVEVAARLGCTKRTAARFVRDRLGLEPRQALPSSKRHYVKRDAFESALAEYDAV